jgi:UDP-GlcNAc:undecaprenyl-phosphate/decaprenyl-phosphate GlcNAc-1-phosphate transferase
MNYFITAFVSLLVSWITLKSVIFIYRKYNWLDKPSTRKNHAQAVPAAGGVAVFLALIVACLILPDLGATFGENLPVFIATLALVVIGAIDDRFNLSSMLRLLLQISCSLFIAMTFVRVDSLHGLLGIYEIGTGLSYAITVLILVGVVNAYNMMDGIDGLAGSFSIVISLSLIGIGIWLGLSEWNEVLIVLIAGLVMFLRFNWRPAKIFMGDSGSMPLGFMFATIGLYFLQGASDSQAQTTVLVTITGLFIVPVMDTLRLFKYRMSKGRSPFSADRNHLHHWLLRNKMAHSQATIRILILQAITLGIGLLAIQFFTITVVVLMQAIIVVLFFYLSKRIASFFKWYGVIRRMEMSAFKEN